MVLAGSLCLTAAPPAAAAEPDSTEPLAVEQTTGSITLNVLFDLPQTRAEVEKRDITLRLSRDGETVLTLPLAAGNATTSSQGISTFVTVKNTAGEELTNEEQIGAYEAVLSGLPAQGQVYTLFLSGTGYGAFQTDITLSEYSQYVTVHTGDGSFPLGDLNQDGKVGEDDVMLMDTHLGETDSASLNTYDLNGDRKIDITDLFYVNFVKDASDVAETGETAAIVSALVDVAGAEVEGNLQDLFQEAGTVTLAPPAGSPPEISIDLSRHGSVEMSQIDIVTPTVQGAVQAGIAKVELMDGSIKEIPFGEIPPEGVHAIGRTAGQNVVTIDLGAKVAVKKVTITVTAVADQTGAVPEYAVVTQIEFLKDIGQDTAESSSQVKGLTAAAGDGKVELVWNPVNNITGYLVRYGTSENALNQSMVTNTNRAVVSGLENMKQYYFQVEATNGSWSGTRSVLVSATPVPASAPGAPSNIRVTPSNQSLRLSWGQTKDASFYQVFYRQAGTGSYTQFGGDLTSTSAVVTGLTNGVQYELAIKAGNSAGIGPYSATVLGTPEPEEIEMPQLPEDGRIPNSMVTSISMYNRNNVNTTLCPSFSENHLIDSDPNTYWIARQWYESSQFTFTFREPQDMNYLIVVPYLGDNHKYAIKTYSIIAYDDQGNELVHLSNASAQRLDTEKNYLVFPFPKAENVSSIALSMGEHEGNGFRVSISEIAFYESDSLPEDIAALFTDGTFTALKPDVTGDKLAELEARLQEKSSFYLEIDRMKDELALARKLYEGDQSALGLVRDNFQSRAAGLDAAYGQSASDFQPLGVSARAGATVAIYAELPEGETVSVVPTQFYGESGIWRGSAIQLTSGRNYITVPKIGDLADERGGMLYLAYAGKHPEEIKLQIRGGSDVFTIPVLELSNWYELTESGRKAVIRDYVEVLQAYVSSTLSGSGSLTTDVRNATEISTPSVLLSIPADQALKGLGGITSASVEDMTEVMYQNVLAWEEVLFVANKVQGIIPSSMALEEYQYPMTTRQNIRYMRMFAGAFMYAAGNHVGVGYGSTSALVCGKPTAQTGEGNSNRLFGWGIAHEIGHNMDKLGRAEITNNIYSLAVQASDGGAMKINTRLTLSNIWTGESGIFSKTAAARPGAANNVFVQLGMYWQLHLAYDGAEEPLAFYNQFFRLWKAGEYSEYSGDERIALIACKTANRDLTEFFTRWGMVLGEETRQEIQAAGYPKEERAVWYLDDSSRTYRLNGGQANSGDTEFSVKVGQEETESVVSLTITNNQPDSIQGYEILRNGVPVGFTTTGEYTDNLGAANNLTYAYSVVPVDKLGNQGEAAQLQEVRVAHEVTIDPTSYTVSPAVSDGGTVTITMNQGKAVPVTGIRVTGETELSGTCTVNVKANPDAAAWTAAIPGAELSGTSMTAYFHKPGAGAEDTRIWTYDAAVLEITGIPAGGTVELLGYPGDRIDFYEGATVGLLEEDYVYGDQPDQVIPWGTLVVVGTYRGDPVFNTLELQARYNTTAEAVEDDAERVTSIERAVNGYGLLFAEIPEDGEVSDTSDGFFLFVPDLEAEAVLNQASNVTDDYPLEIRMVFYRTDDPNDSTSRRVTSQTLWISFPEEDSLPLIELTGGQA